MFGEALTPMLAAYGPCGLLWSHAQVDIAVGGLRRSHLSTRRSTRTIESPTRGSSDKLLHVRSRKAGWVSMGEHPLRVSGRQWPPRMPILHARIRGKAKLCSWCGEVRQLAVVMPDLPAYAQPKSQLYTMPHILSLKWLQQSAASWRAI